MKTKMLNRSSPDIHFNPHPVPLSGVQADEDLQSSEVGPTLDGTAVTGGDTSGESGLGLVWCVCSCRNSRSVDLEQIC